MAGITHNSNKLSAIMQGVTAGVIGILILFGTYHYVFTLTAFALCCFIILQSNDESYVVALLFFIMPMASIFKLSPSSSSVFTYVELLLVIMHYLKKKFRVERADAWVLILTLYVVVCECVSGTVSITRTIKFFVNLMLIGVFVEQYADKAQKKIFVYFILGMIVSSFMQMMDSSFLQIEKYTTLKTIGFGEEGREIRFSGLFTDPNYYAINAIIALCLLVILYMRSEILLLPLLVCGAILMYFCGLTGSKSALVMLGMPVLLWLYGCIRKRRWFLLSISIVGACVFIVLIFSGRIEAFDVVVRRLSIEKDSSISELTTGRSDLWTMYLNYFVDNPLKMLVGNGVGLYLLNNAAPHNTYIDFLYQLGITGTILFFICISMYAAKCKTIQTRTIANYVVIIIELVMCLFLSQLQGYDLPFQISLCILVLNMNITIDKAPRLMRVRY